MSKKLVPKRKEAFDAVLSEVRAKYPDALGYQQDEMAHKEYERRYRLNNPDEDDSPYEPDYESEFERELDEFFAQKLGQK